MGGLKVQAFYLLSIFSIRELSKIMNGGEIGGMKYFEELGGGGGCKAFEGSQKGQQNL